MPPRPSSNLTSSFTAQDPANEVVCPLINHDGSQCRKRCFGDKRYRSMQEHIRRAHPQHYISKLPASAESIRAMVEKIPDEIPPSQQTSPQQLSQNTHAIQQQQHSYSNTESQQHEQSSYANTSMFAPNHLRRGSLLQSANAAAALAQLHNSRPEPDWQGHHVSTSKSSKSLFITLAQDAYGDTENDQDYMHNYFAHPPSNDIFEDDQQSGDISSHMLQGSSFDRSFLPRSSSTQFPRKPNRPRKSSVTENARKGKHERERSKDLKRLSHDRKSLEPGHKRWEDLLDAAQSATEEESRDLTPIPQSPRSSIPPFNANQFHSYTASPLQNTLLPQDSTDENTPSYNAPGLEPFPSVESSYDQTSQQQFQSHQHQSSADSTHSNVYSSYPAAVRHHASSTGSNFHMPPEGLSSSSQDNTPLVNHFGRPQSSGGNTTHYPHPLHAAHLAQASQQQQQQQQQQQHQHHSNHQQHPYSAHHASFSAATGSGTGGQGAHLQEPAPPLVQHYCAACKRITPLVHSYACTECICGICRDCFDVLTSMDAERSTGCPNCHVHGGKYKPFMLDLR